MFISALTRVSPSPANSAINSSNELLVARTEFLVKLTIEYLLIPSSVIRYKELLPFLIIFPGLYIFSK